jgi:hypothetical protein
MWQKEEKKEKTIKEILKDLDFSNDIDYDTNSEQAEDHDERCEGDYCRCSTLHPTINSFGYAEIADRICEQFNIVEEKTKYCIERICSTLTIGDFYCHVCGGYYGEEMNGITLDNYEIVDKLEEIIDIKTARKKKLKQLNEISKSELSDDKIRQILIMEYGYLLDELKISSFSVIEIDTQDIIFPQEEHSKNLNKDKVNGYKNHSGICGIVKEKNGKYKVIDGYHRITANLNKTSIKVILST